MSAIRVVETAIDRAKAETDFRHYGGHRVGRRWTLGGGWQAHASTLEENVHEAKVDVALARLLGGVPRAYRREIS